MLKDVLVSTVVLVVSGCFRVFDTIYVITKGGPMNSSQLLSTYMYQTAFEKYNGGYASAIAVVMILIGVLPVSYTHLGGCFTGRGGDKNVEPV